MAEQKGWECPKCDRVWAPWVVQCSCSEKKKGAGRGFQRPDGGVPAQSQEDYLGGGGGQ